MRARQWQGCREQTLSAFENDFPSQLFQAVGTLQTKRHEEKLTGGDSFIQLMRRVGKRKRPAPATADMTAPQTLISHNLLAGKSQNFALN